MTNHKLNDRVRISTLREITKLVLISSIIKIKTLKLFGHIKRSKLGHSKLCLEGMIEGKRKRGKPPRRWLDNVKACSGMNIRQLNVASQNRILWRQISNVNAHSAT